MPSKFVQLGDHAVHFLHTGPTTLPDVPPVLDRGTLFVLLHCAGGCAALWQRQVSGLAERHSVVALDLPAHGRSSGVAALGTLDASVALLARFAETLRLRPFVLVGHCLGAQVAVRFAVAHAASLRGLVLLGPALRPDHGDAMATLRQVVMGRLPQQFSPDAFSPSSTPDVMREFFTAFVTTDPRVRLTDFEAAHGQDAAAVCGRVRTPTLVIAGADDRIVAAAQSEAVAQAIAGARFASLDAAGYAAPLEQGEAVNRLLADFAGGLS